MSAEEAILWCAARAVPERERAEWLAEWTAEMWYVREQDASTVGFCWGAFRDAWWMRRNCRPSLRLETPLECLGWLGLLATAFALGAFAIRDARHEILPFPYRGAERLVLLSPVREAGSRLPVMTVGQYRLLAGRRGSPFEGVAFYRVMRTREGARERAVAVASENLLPLLGSPPQGRGFVRVAPDSWLLPGRVEAAVFDDAVIAALPEATRGYVVGRLLRADRDGARNLMVPNGSGGQVRIRLGPLRSYPPYALPAVVFICLLVAAATTSSRLRGRAHDRHYRPWMLLGAKIVLLALIGFFVILMVQAMVGFEIRPLVMPLYVIAFRWALIDQQKRCPECLRRLLLPVRIGAPSQTFLGWYGTEFVCGKGHGVLLAPETPTASFSQQDWFHLDDSWTAAPHDA